MQTLRLTAIVLITSLLFACANPVDISSDYDKEIDFSAFKTYSWHKGNEYNKRSKSFLNNDILDKRIRNNVNEQMLSKGFQLKDADPADLYVNYTVSTEPQIDVSTYNTYGGFAPGFSAGYYGAGAYRYGGVGVVVAPQMESETRITHYEQGTFVLDFVDAKSNQLIWRGTATGKLRKNASAAEREAAAGEIVTEVLANFPPK